MSDHPEDHQDEADPTDGMAAADADERELLAAFDRLSPQGSLRWGFDDAMGRIEHAELNSATSAVPWRGLPDDLWERGHSARIGQRFVGDVAGVLADILATDARAVADAAVSGVNVAVWDALRHLAARVEILEARVDPLRLEAAEWPLPTPDPSAWLTAVDAWLGPADGDDPVVVGESGDGALLAAVRAAGRTVVGVEPRGASVWRARASVPADPGVDVVFGDVAAHLRTIPADGAAAVILLGCVDRADLVGKLVLVEEAVRITRPGGTVIVLTTDPGVWETTVEVPARDLLPGRPFHPETWCWMLNRAKADAQWHRPSSGELHAVVAKVRR
jgi:SAM-dependent methyltransferase